MLDYVALGMLCFSAVVVFYGIIVIHDIPYEIAKHRNHPHCDAIHVAGWVSLFTLHILWPFLWIWSTLYREDRGWGFSNAKPMEPQLSGLSDLSDLKAEVAELKNRLDALDDSVKSQIATNKNNSESVKSEIVADKNNTEVET